MKKILVVDLCGTVVYENTTQGFLRQARLPLPWRMLADLLLSRISTFPAHRFDCEQLHRKALIACLRGLPRFDLLRQAEEYARSALSSRARLDVLRRIKAAQDEGVRVVLASASLDFIVEGFAKALFAESAVSTRLMYRADDRCVGRIAVDSTGRKLVLLNEYVKSSEFGFDVITDNAEDTDLMQAAENVWFIHAQD